MHELAICQQLLTQVQQISVEHDAVAVSRIVVSAGAISGVEPELLARAFALARAGTVAAGAALVIETSPLKVRCRSCERESVAAAARLVCGYCRSYRTDIVSGDELMLLRVEFQRTRARSNPAPSAFREDKECVTPVDAM